MAQNLGKWIQEATVDARGFQTGVRSMIDSSRNAQNQLSSIFDRISATVNLSPTTFLSGLSIGGFMQQFQRATETAENIGFLNDQLGTSIEWLTALRTAAGESGIRAEQFEGSIQRLQQTIGNAALGSTEAQATFRDLGLSWERLRTQRFETTFAQVAGALAGIEDRSVRARLSMELFGREGGRVMQRLTAGGAEGVAATIADLQGRGGFMTQADLDRLLQAANALDSMATRSANFGRNLMSAVAPFITGILEGLERLDAGIARIIQNMRGQVPSMQMAWAPRQDQIALTPEEFQNQQNAFAAAQGVAPPQNPLANAGTSIEELQGSQRLAFQQEGAASVRVAMAEQAVAAARQRLAAAPRGDRLLGGGPTAEQQAAMQALADAEHSLNARRQEAAEAAARLAQAENLVNDARAQAEREAQRAREDQMRQDEAQMNRIRQMTVAAQTPFEAMQARLRGFEGQGLTEQQQGRLIRNTIGQTQASPLLGSLSADSSETAAIIQASMNPQVDVARSTLDILRQMQADQERQREEDRQIAQEWREFRRQVQGN